MGVAIGRALAFGAILLGFAGTVAVAQPPGKDESPASERAKLQAQLQVLIDRLNAQLAEPSPRPGGVPRPKFDLDPTKAIDTLRLATNLFRDGDYDAALRAFRFIQPLQLPPEDRPFAKYMTACCLRRLNRLSDAAVIYREVAAMPEDEFLAGCAVSQLALIRSQQDLEAQLEQLRARAKGR
jgi:hypothetical protein